MAGLMTQPDIQTLFMRHVTCEIPLCPRRRWLAMTGELRLARVEMQPGNGNAAHLVMLKKQGPETLPYCHNHKKNNNNQAFPSVLLLPHGGHTWLTCVGQTAGWKPEARLPASVAYLDQHKDVGAMALAVSVNTFPPRNHPPPQHETNKPPPCDDISYSVTFAWLHWMLPRLALCAMLMNSCNGWIRPQHPFFEEEPAPIWMAVLKHSTRSVSNSEMSVWYIDAWIHTVAHKVCSYLYV